MSDELVAAAFNADELRAGAAVALASIDEQPRAIEPIHRGNRKRTAVVRFLERDPVVVQVCEEPAWLRTEAVLLSEIRERTDVPVPPVLVSGCHDGVAYVLTEYVAGDDLHERFPELSPGLRRTLVESFGSYLAQLHETFQFDGYGRLVPSGERLTPQRADWGAWFREYGDRAVGRLPQAFDPLRSELRGLITDVSTESSPSARLYPWDFRPGNALVVDGSVTALLDWEAPLAAPASLSVAKAEYLVADWYVPDPEPLRDAFRTGYTSVRSYPSVSGAERVAAIADSAVDSTGEVTNPQYPELEADESVAFHRRALEDCL